ncbi:hypothetical protein [Streptomyces lydicus]|uniref:hypothetical protein n=1 Tax=Streptomyces lydicus TaxID=47763 RepID=UPI0010129C08|nr:hypothetical protein [Streptomyces lydicus]MCZ1007348.1 hypothetical protein [Streptomyces lydicus]
MGLTTVVALVESEKESWWNQPGEPASRDIKGAALVVVKSLLSTGLMKAGELSTSIADQCDFLDWPGSTQKILEYISDEWGELTSLDRFEPCWLRSTDAGREAGRAIDS